MRAILALALLAPAIARGDAPPEATALFDRGIKDLQAGNLEQACKELAASLARYADSGTKGALATCFARQGKVVSAWNLWRDLADTAPADMRADAGANAASLEPRLPHFVLRAEGAPAGLVVTVNGAVADPSLGVPLPVDPGPVVASAHAPDHRDWSQTFQASEGKTITIEVPPLVELARAPAPSPPRVVPISDHEPHHHRSMTGLVIAGAGLAVVGVGIVFGELASSSWNDAQSACGPAGIKMCQMSGFAAAKSDVDSTRTSGLVSTIAFAAGGAALVGGALYYLFAPVVDERATALRVSPTVGSYGLALSGGW